MRVRVPLPRPKFVLHRKLERVYNLFTINFQSLFNHFYKQKNKKQNKIIIHKSIKNKKHKKYNGFYCKLCGQPLVTGIDYCRKCKPTMTQRKVERPPKEALLKEIKTASFLAGVSDKAISNWCKYYGLPYRKKDIKLLK